MKLSKRIMLSLLMGSFIFTTPMASLAALREPAAKIETAAVPKAAPGGRPGQNQNRPAPNQYQNRPAPNQNQNRPAPNQNRPGQNQYRPEPNRPAPNQYRPDNRRPSRDDRHDDNDALKVGGAMLLLGLILGSSQNNSNNY